MSGDKISDMTISVTLPSGSYAPFVVTDVATGLNPSLNYRYDLGARMVATDAAIALRPTSAVLAASGGAALIGYTFGSADSVARTAQARLRDAVSVADFDSFQHALDYIGASGGTLLIPAGTYAITSQLTLTPTTLKGISIIGYGTEFTTTGAISALKIVSAFNLPAQIVVEGIKVNHRGNATATAGFELIHSNHVTFRNCEVEAHGVSATYGAFWFHMSDPTDIDTGCFWNSIEGCTVRKRDSSPGDITYGVKLQGVCNQTRIVGGSLGNTTTGVYMVPESGQTAISNAILIDGTAFEGFTTAIHAAAAAAAPVSGLRIQNCRAESGTTFISLTGATSQPATPMYAAGNYLVPGVAYLNNPNSLYYTSLDSSNANGAIVSSGAVVAIKNTAGTGHTLDLYASATGAVIQEWKKTDGTLLASITWVTDANTALTRLTGSNASLQLAGINSISQTTTAARNLRGQATASDAATTAVWTFGTAEPDATYFVTYSVASTAGGPAAGSLIVTDVTEATGSVTLTLSAAPGAGKSVTYNIFLIR